MEILRDRELCHVRPDDPTLLKLVMARALSAGRPIRPLHLQALLQLPRIANLDGTVQPLQAEDLLGELAQELPGQTEWSVPGTVTGPHEFDFRQIDSTIARQITERFHYLRSPRTDGRAYGLFTNTDFLIGLCVSSPLDIPHIRNLLETSRHSSDRTRVVSRVFVFEGAPRNCISYLLSRTGREERLLGIRNLVTYVNPNMGFTGVSYRASGWRLLGEESGTTYRYLDARYMTDRHLAELVGERDDAEYFQLLGDRFSASRMFLRPLLIFHVELS